MPSLPRASRGTTMRKSTTTTKNAQDRMKLNVPKKKDNLARAFAEFAPATDRITPTKERDRLMI